MAFRTNKMPAIEERTVSGSSVSFNSAFALPLKACKVSFSATQAGSGDPSPSNPRAISGVSAIGLTANSTPVSVSLGDTRYGGVLDVVNGKMSITHIYKSLNDSSKWQTQSGTLNLRYNEQFNDRLLTGDSTTGLICTIFQTATSGTEYCRWAGASSYQFTAHSESTLSDIQTLADNNKIFIVYPLADPITIQLSANELSSIIGNNTFSTDTGTLEITFADLQEKSASGSVASFNTALAMPLASCNIAVNAWQEGSGEPSPDNVRPIHGFSEVTATRCGKNLFPFGEWYIPYDVNNSYLLVGNNSIFLKSGTYRLSFEYKRIDAPSINSFWRLYSSHVTSVDATKQVQYGSLSLASESEWTRKSISVTISQNGWFGLDDSQLKGGVSYRNIQLEVGSTATAYEPYVTPTIYTIQLGETVYGGSYNIDGTKRKSKNKIVLNGTESWNSYGAYNGFVMRISDMKVLDTSTDGICDRFNIINNLSNMGVRLGAGNNYVYFTQITNNISGVTDITTWKTWLSNNPVELVYPLAEPIETDIGATPISTNIGNNTIFADAGDVDLTYKDLDIAKRGNFREVFKLPS